MRGVAAGLVEMIPTEAVWMPVVPIDMRAEPTRCWPELWWLQSRIDLNVNNLAQPIMRVASTEIVGTSVTWL